MANKITKKDNFLKLKALVSDPELIAFIDNELALLAKKNGAKKTPTKTQKENASIKETILNAMVSGVDYSVSEIIDLTGMDMTNQKASALITQLVDSNQIIRTVDKRKAYFKKIA